MADIIWKTDEQTEIEGVRRLGELKEWCKDNGLPFVAMIQLENGGTNQSDVLAAGHLPAQKYLDARVHGAFRFISAELDPDGD